jgi:hypothetical protein
VSRYLLDTNVISNVTKTVPSESLLTWMAEQVDEDLSSLRSPSPRFGAACWKSLPAAGAISSKLSFGLQY